MYLLAIVIILIRKYILSDYIVATIKPWNITYFEQWQTNQQDNWHLFTDVDQLNLKKIKEINPRYIFFPHWSWLVPEEILNNYECVCFHMTDVPYGRGGTPLQNLISRGHIKTKISSLKMTKILDAGPVYLKSNLSLLGSAQEIYERATPIIFKMIEKIVTDTPIATKQHGNVEVFKRRTPDQSLLPAKGNIEKLYDHIRMLDAHSYPNAELTHGDFKLLFKEAKLEDGSLTATVCFEKNHDNND